MLIQNIQNYESVFLKDTFSITFQQFRKYLFRRQFLKIHKTEETLLAKIFKIIKNVSLKTLSLLIQKFKNYVCVFSKDIFSITFQQFRKCLFKKHFLKIRKTKSVS